MIMSEQKHNYDLLINTVTFHNVYPKNQKKVASGDFRKLLVPAKK